MPKVPGYENFQSSVSTMPDVHVADTLTADEAQVGPKQIMGVGKALEGMGDAEAKIAVDAQNQANELRVSDAMNQARQKALDLAYDPAQGYLNLKGQAALERPDGVALPEEYGAKLGTGLTDIAGTLSNDAQRRLFTMQAAQLHTNFQGDVERHMLGEFTTYHQSVADGAEKLATQEAELNWSNPAKVDQAINGIEDPESGERHGGIKQSIYQKARLSGLSANEAEAAMTAAESNVHAKVIESALTNNNPTYAMQYFSTNKGKMTGDDLLKVQGQINHQMDATTAVGAVTASTSKYSSNFMPSDMDRLDGIVKNMESGGKRYAENGAILMSPKGAKGEMQVMPDTAKNPGYGIKPSDGTPEDDARVGHEYLPAMLKKYGDVGQALAAYNAGPGTLNDALGKAKAAGNPAAWLSYMPKETQDYVTSGVKSFGAGSGAPALPTKMEFVSDAVARLGDTPRIEALSATREQAEKQYDLMVTSRKEQGDQALAAAQKELIANGGDFSQLSPKTASDLSRFDPGKYDDAYKFAKSIKNGENTTNMEAYANAVTYPNELANMSDTDFVQFLKTNFSSRDQEKIATLRAHEINGTNNDSASGINNTALNTALSGRLEDMGIASKPKTTDKTGRARVGAIQKFIRDDIYEQQNQLGRKMTPEELDGRLDTLFSKSVELPGVLWGTNTEPLLAMKPSDVPSNVRTVIMQQFKNFGILNPSDNDILRAYWKNKSNNAMKTAKNGQ